MKAFSSPKVLVDAANSPVQELPPVAMRPDKIHYARPWGFKGTMVKPDDWHSREARPVLTPDHWKWLSLAQQPDGYALLSFATQTPILKADLKFLKMEGAKIHGLTHKQALATGEQIEAAFNKLPQPERPKRRSRIPLDSDEAEWENTHL